MSEEYELEGSVRKVGRLVPIIKDAHGNIIDGFHRQKFDPEWEQDFSVTVDHVADPVQLVLARMNVNVCRRVVSAEEKSKWLRELVELTGWDAKKIAEVSGMGYRWVLKYLPDEFKNKTKSEVGKLGGDAVAARRAPKSEDSRQPKKLVECEQCHKEVMYPHYVNVDGQVRRVCVLCKDQLSKGSTPQKASPKQEKAPATPATTIPTEPEITKEEDLTDIETVEGDFDVETTTLDTTEDVIVDETPLESADFIECAECQRRFRVVHMADGTHQLEEV